MAMLDFRKNDAGDMPVEQMPVSQIMWVQVTDIDFSHVNPRRSKGDNYEHLKESIRQIGLQTILTITKIPGEERYRLYNGGNSRLQAVKELYEEYLAAGDMEQANRFRQIQVRFVPYTNDIDSLVKQIAENEERSAMTFIDKARAVAQIRQIYLHQHELKEISNRQLVKYIHQLGWTSINHPSMTELNFAFEHLSAIIPLALDAGLGKPKIQQLRVWLDDVEVWLDWLVKKFGYDYSVAQGRQLYFDVLAKHDSEFEALSLHDFFQDFRMRLGDVLMTFDRRWNAQVILFELESLEIVGGVKRVREEVPVKELIKQLDETSNGMPPARFPTPRKPRTPRAVHPEEHNGDDGTVGSEVPGNDSGGGDTGSFAAVARSAPQIDPEMDNAEDIPPLVNGNQLEKYLERKREEANVYQRFPPLQLPDRKLPLAEYNQAIRGRCMEIVNQLLEQYDSQGVIRDLLVTDDDPDMTESAPYAYLLVDSEDKYGYLKLWLDAASHTERYATLHFIMLFGFHVRRLTTPEDQAGFNDAERTSLANLERLCNEYAAQYVDYRLMCHTDTVWYADLGSEAPMALTLVDQMIHTHLALIYSIVHRQGIEADQQAEGT